MSLFDLGDYPVLGEIISNYEIVEVIDTTLHWQDYKATHTILSKPFIIRIMEVSYSSSPNFQHIFRRESRTSSRLKHPNIFSLVSAGKFGQYFYLVREYLDIKKLEDLIQIFKKLSPKHVIDIGLQLCEALIYAHKNKVLHRNMNPSNVVLDQDGRVLLTDFGFSALQDQPQSGQTLMFNVDLQSEIYQAPELSNTPPVADEASDIFSLCAVLYFALTGQRAFKNPLDKLDGKLIELDNVEPDIPEELVEIIHKCLSIEPVNRFENAKALSNALKKVNL